MKAAHVRHLPVIEEGSLVGVVTQTNLLEASRRQLASTNVKLVLSAGQDALTQLANRKTFDETLSVELERVERYSGLLSIALFDLDYFKAINDLHGHIAGDDVLRAFANLLRQAGRRIDLPARYGGEEFIVLLPAVGSSGAKIFADRVRKRLSKTLIPSGDQLISVTVSSGVAMWLPQLGGSRELITLADEALYKAKEAGKNTVVIAN